MRVLLRISPIVTGGPIAGRLAGMLAGLFVIAPIAFATPAISETPAANPIAVPIPEASPRPPVPAKNLFGAEDRAANLAPRAIGFYSKGCLAGGKALPVDGPTWQTMRLSRNRNWGHPQLLSLIERLAHDAAREDGWPGLLVGDLAQPRGGPMLTGHASHQIGLDADIWLTPMPKRRLSWEEREKTAAVSMLADQLSVNAKVFTPEHVKLIKRAASYPEVERIGVNPAIKLALCRAEGGDQPWLHKVQSWPGHHYHMHIRIKCPANSEGCTGQPPPTNSTCAHAEKWYADTKAYLALPKKPTPQPQPPAKPKPPVTLADLPADCGAVLAAAPAGVSDGEIKNIVVPARKPVHREAAKAP